MAQQRTYEVQLHSIKALQRRRNQLLDEIKRSGSDSPILKEQKADILLQKKRYNNLIDDLIQMDRGPFADPLVTLPLELWIKIIYIIASLNENSTSGPNPINQLLNLTGVSKAWSNALLSIPSFWTTVVLNADDEDCFAKVMTSIQLSATLELDVVISLPLDVWAMAAPMVTPQGHRIHTLTIIPLQDHNMPSQRQELPELLNILGSFDHLPILRHLRIVSLGGTFHPSALNRMPSLQTVADLPLRRETVASLRGSGIQRITVTQFDKYMVENLLHLPNLRHLELLLEYSSPKTDQMPSSTLRLPISSINIQRSEVYPLDSILMCLGLNLQRITIGYVDVARFFNTLSSLQQFQRISHISLHLTQTRSQYGIPPSERTAYYLPAVKVLELYFSPQSENGPSSWIVQWTNSIFGALITAMPSVESLVLVGVPSRAFLPYIKRLAGLRRLVLRYFNKLPSSLSPFVAEQLEYLDWSGNMPADFFDHFQCPSLHTVSLNGTSGKPETVPIPSYSTTSFRVPTLLCTIPLRVTSSVTQLSLTFVHPICWDLASFPAVKHVRLAESIWVSDFFEQLAVRPNDCPNLEHITVEGGYYEWDILILMLERRNFATRTGVSTIKSIKFSSDLPFKLLHPISDLLRGKFLTHIQIADFSLKTIAKRMFNQSWSGCTHCCQIFRECDFPTIPGATYNPFGSAGLGWRYSLPFRLLDPNPALLPEVADWIATKRTRRVEFDRKSQEGQFHRIADCGREGREPSRPITAYSMEFD